MFSGEESIEEGQIYICLLYTSAGFAEIGETIEETVHREVMEEVGLKVKNLRYYKSQPWSFSGTLLFGFFCDVDGDDTLTVDHEEPVSYTHLQYHLQKYKAFQPADQCESCPEQFRTLSLSP